jgi:hypothetical protein
MTLPNVLKKEASQHSNASMDARSPSVKEVPERITCTELKNIWFVANVIPKRKMM